MMNDAANKMKDFLLEVSAQHSVRRASENEKCELLNNFSPTFWQFQIHRGRDTHMPPQTHHCL